MATQPSSSLAPLSPADAAAAQQCLLFQHLLPQQREVAAARAAHLRFRKGEELLRADAPSPGLFVILRGAAAVLQQEMSQGRAVGEWQRTTSGRGVDTLQWTVETPPLSRGAGADARMGGTASGRWREERGLADGTSGVLQLQRQGWEQMQDMERRQQQQQQVSLDASMTEDLTVAVDAATGEDLPGSAQRAREVSSAVGAAETGSGPAGDITALATDVAGAAAGCDEQSNGLGFRHKRLHLQSQAGNSAAVAAAFGGAALASVAAADDTPAPCPGQSRLLHLGPGDWFGHPPSPSPQPLSGATVVAASDVLDCAYFSYTPRQGTLNGGGASAATATALPSLAALSHPSSFCLVPSPADYDRLLNGKLEEVLSLTPLTTTPDSFAAHTPRGMRLYPRIFGGQLVGQALAAACMTVEDKRLLPHSLHSYFLRPGNPHMPVVYRVERIRDGSAFAARRVRALQQPQSTTDANSGSSSNSGGVSSVGSSSSSKSSSNSGNRVLGSEQTPVQQGASDWEAYREIFILTASFHRDEPGLSFSAPPPPGVPPPSSLPTEEEEEWRLRCDARVPVSVRKKMMRKAVRPLPVDMRYCTPLVELACKQIMVGAARLMQQEGFRAHGGARRHEASKHGRSDEFSACRSEGTKESKQECTGNGDRDSRQTSMNVWFRARGVSPLLASDQRMQRCIVAYFSDFILIGASLLPHSLFPIVDSLINAASLDHAVWFHEPCHADEWLLYAVDTTWSGSARGMNHGRMFTREGRLAVSVVQEGLIRPKFSVPGRGAQERGGVVEDNLIAKDGKEQVACDVQPHSIHPYNAIPQSDFRSKHQAKL